MHDSLDLVVLTLTGGLLGGVGALIRAAFPLAEENVGIRGAWERFWGYRSVLWGGNQELRCASENLEDENFESFDARLIGWAGPEGSRRPFRSMPSGTALGWVPVFVEESPETKGRTVNRASVEKATEEWRQARFHPHQGNDRFFKYALALRSAGMTLTEIENRLRTEARFGRSPNKRQKHVRSIIDSLKKRPTRKAIA
jgi:hypothetical protein